jgi:hypothetical protein
MTTSGPTHLHVPIMIGTIEDQPEFNDLIQEVVILKDRIEQLEKKVLH